ncbi:MAG: hypothetical protein ABIG30_01635, partial [Candidatus Aenigmatarchaeota archaeon]
YILYIERLDNDELHFVLQDIESGAEVWLSEDGYWYGDCRQMRETIWHEEELHIKEFGKSFLEDLEVDQETKNKYLQFMLNGKGS